MKKTQLRFGLDDIAGYDFYPFLKIANLINLNLKLREESNEKLCLSLNYNIILQCTTLIEGSIGQILDSVIEYRKGQLERSDFLYKDFTIQALQDLEDKIDKAQWVNYPEIFKVVFGINIKSSINSELWKAINVLFKFRNALVHGNVVTIEYHPIESSEEARVIVLKKYKDIYDFLSEKKLIRMDSNGYVNIMNNSVADFFVEKSKEFIPALVNIIEDKIEKSIVNGRLIYLDEQNRSEI